MHDLNSFLKTHALRTGDFTLSSGQKATEYLDVKSAALRCGGQYELGWALSNQVQFGIQAVAGVELGGVFLATAVGWLRNLPILIVRKEAQQHGTQESIIGLENLDRTKVTNVCLIEDVITTGASTLKALDKLTLAGLVKGIKVTHVLAVVDREQGGIQNIVDKLKEKGIEDVQVKALTTMPCIRSAALLKEE